MVLSILNSDPSCRDTENLPPNKLLASPQKPKAPNGRSRAHNIPGGIKHLLSDPKRRRRVSSRSAALLFPPRIPSRSTRSRGKCVNTPKTRHTSATSITQTRGTQIQSSVPISVTFPRCLPDLPRKQISAEVLSSLGFAPQVPTQYIRDQMDRLSPSMYQALRSTSATASGGTLPKTLLITVNEASAMLPTHMAAVYSSAPSAPEPRRVTMYPVHQSILSLYCANLPVLPPSTPRPTTPNSPFQVPVVPLALPHPESFPLLTQFLYLKDRQPLFQTFLCLTPVNGLREDLDPTTRCDALVTEYSTILAQNYTTQRLASQAVMVHGFWRNACALGIFDIDLQAFFDLAWGVLMKALILSSNHTPTTAVVSA